MIITLGLVAVFEVAEELTHESLGIGFGVDHARPHLDERRERSAESAEGQNPTGECHVGTRERLHACVASDQTPESIPKEVEHTDDYELRRNRRERCEYQPHSSPSSKDSGFPGDVHDPECHPQERDDPGGAVRVARVDGGDDDAEANDDAEDDREDGHRTSIAVAHPGRSGCEPDVFALCSRAPLDRERPNDAEHVSAGSDEATVGFRCDRPCAFSFDQ